MSLESFLLKILGVKKRRRPSSGELDRFNFRVPKLRKLYGTHQEELKTFALKEWSQTFKLTDVFEVRSLCLYHFQHRSLSRTEINALISWPRVIDCWEHSDDLAKILARFHEENPKHLRPVLKKWNQSPYSWERRQSLTALLEYACARQKFPPVGFMLSLVRALLHDEDYYVQKAVGWTLREIGNCYPKETGQFLERHLLSLDSRAYSAAVEKLPSALKSRYRRARSPARQQRRLTVKKKSID